MTNIESKLIKPKLGVLELAKQLGSVSAACKTLDIVLDPFGGSGSTLIVAEHTGRQARLIELDLKYVDVIVRRWQKMTGLQATLSGTDQEFKAVEKDRLGGKAEASLPVEGE